MGWGEEKQCKEFLNILHPHSPNTKILPSLFYLLFPPPICLFFFSETLIGNYKLVDLLPLLHHVFLNNKDIHLYNHHTMIKISNLTLIQYY